MGYNENIIQWNCNGIKHHYPELKTIILERNPFSICLQESHLKPGENFRLRGYNAIRHDVIPDQRARGGVITFIKENIHFNILPIQTQLQVVAITIQYPIEMTICNLYLPNADWTPRCLRNLLQQLPEPFMIVGDLNVHNPLWGSSRSCPGGRILEEIINDLDLVLLNTGTNKKNKVPWWNAELETANREKKRAFNIFKRSPTTENTLSLKKLRAKFRYLQNKSKKESWSNFVNSISSETPMAEIWDKIRAIKGKGFCPTSPVLMINGEAVSGEENIAEEMAIHFESTSSTEKYEDTLHKEEKERNYLDFKTDSDLPYNAPFCLNELNHVLSSMENTAAGIDQIPYEMIKELPENMKIQLLNLFNEIWKQGTYQYQSQEKTTNNQKTTAPYH
ncbi:hypothetical protein JTB14_021075 [Gonioctena quinquepunctata]|nr:hypothetical protein JTB14_021075 [Gonioctena quinquepunctata]